MKRLCMTIVLLLGAMSNLTYAHYHELGWGEPYELAGKRMVFTTWYWVRWKGAEDLGVSVRDPIVLRFRMDKAKIYGLDFE